jgi:hypothetical protein
MQDEQPTESIAALQRHLETQQRINDAVIDAQVAREQQAVADRREALEASMAEAIAAYYRHVNALIRLQQGIAQVSSDLDSATQALPDVEATHPAASILERERARRESHFKSLQSRLQYGEVLLRKIPKSEETATSPGQAAAGQDLSEIEHRIRDIRQETQVIYQTVLAPYLQLNVIPETKSLWKSQVTLYEQLTGHSGQEVRSWGNARGALWEWWQQALDEAGFPMEIPGFGVEVDYTIHEIADVVDVPAAELADLDWRDQAGDRVWDVAWPGLRWKPQDLLVLTAGVIVARPVEVDEMPGHEPEDGAAAAPLAVNEAVAGNLEDVDPGEPLAGDGIDELDVSLEAESDVAAEPLVEDDAVAGDPPHATWPTSPGDSEPDSAMVDTLPLDDEEDDR